MLPAITARDCNLDPLELDYERGRACLLAAECGLFADDPSALPMCLLSFNELSQPDFFSGPITGTCALDATTCQEVVTCLDARGLPPSVGDCAELETTTCADDMLSFCDAAGQRYEHDCAERGLKCAEALDDFDAQLPGCYPAGCVFYQERFLNTCDGEVLVASIPVEGASHANASEVRLSCPAFGYAACGSGRCTR